jgi:peptidoglycan/LPS O-acetylase OafA/YrhL
VSHFVRFADVRVSDLAGSLFFVHNYQYAAHPRGLYTEQFWSLGVEEHFYFLWPAILLWLGNRRGLWFALAAAGASATWRFALLTHPLLRTGWLFSATAGLAAIRTDARLDGLLLGCALALLLELPAARLFVFRNFTKEMPWLIAVGIFVNLLLTHFVPTLTTYLLLACILASTIIVKEGLAYRLLNLRPLVWLGSISYSIYIWQQLFLLRPSGSPALGRLSLFPLNLICVFVAASCSYYLLERHMIAFGRSPYARKMNDATSADVELRALMLD